VDFQGILAAIRRQVAFLEGRARQLPGLAGGHEAQTQLLGQGRTEDEAPGFQPQHMGGLEGEHRRGHGLHGPTEGLGIRQQGRDIPKVEARLGEIGDLANVLLEIHGFSLRANLERKG